MADFMMCIGLNCRKRAKCLRYTAKAHPFQFHADLSPKEGLCESFMSNEGQKDDD